jgi:hypothetical protein
LPRLKVGDGASRINANGDPSQDKEELRETVNRSRRSTESLLVSPKCEISERALGLELASSGKSPRWSLHGSTVVL